MAEWLKALVLKTSDVERHRGFESLSLRHHSAVEKYPSGRRGSPAKGVGWDNRRPGSNPGFSASSRFHRKRDFLSYLTAMCFPKTILTCLPIPSLVFSYIADHDVAAAGALGFFGPGLLLWAGIAVHQITYQLSKPDHGNKPKDHSRHEPGKEVYKTFGHRCTPFCKWAV